MITTKAGHR